MLASRELSSARIEMLGKRYRGSRLSFDFGVTNQMTISGLKQISLFLLDVCGVWTLALVMAKTKNRKISIASIANIAKWCESLRKRRLPHGRGFGNGGNG